MLLTVPFIFRKNFQRRMGITDDFHNSVAPLITFFILCNIIGFFGNVSVLYIYSLRYPKNRYRLLVIVLSVIDLVACCTTVPIETVSTWKWFDAPSSSLCKARFFFIMFIGLSALYMLFVTAVYKYRRICKPFAKQVTQKMIIILCVVGVVIAFVYAIPPLILFDVNKHYVTIDNMTEEALICEVHTSFHGTQIPAVYRHLVVVYSLLLVTTVILYIFVAKTTIQHVKRMKRKPKSSGTASASESELAESSLDQTTSTTCQSVSKATDGENKSSKIYVVEERSSGPDPSDDTKRTSNDSAARCQDNVPSLPKSQLSSYQVRTVLIMVIVAGTFSITFMMGLAFGYVFALRKYEDYSSIGELVFLFACYRLYFLNYCMNPVVYFALDRRFRKEVFEIYSTMKTVVKKRILRQ